MLQVRYCGAALIIDERMQIYYQAPLNGRQELDRP